MPQQQVPTPRGQEVTQATPYQQQMFPPQCPAPKLSTTPVPARVMGTRLEKRKAPEVGPHPEGLRTGNEGTNPPPEDPRSADRVLPATVSGTRWPTMWPQGEARPHPLHRLLLGGPDRFLGPGQMARGHHQVLGVMAKWKVR